MQSKGALKLFTILLVIGCIYQLSFSFITRSVEKAAVEYAAAFDESEQAAKEAYYLDSIQNQPVFSLLGLKDFTYKECKEKEVNLGLDLKGGMNVMLEIEVLDLVKSLAGESQEDPAFVEALAQANEALKAGTNDYIGEFAKAYEKTSNGGSLAAIFVSPDRKDITPNSSNDEVVKVLRSETDAAIAASFNILRSRIDHFGVTQPNIQRLPNSNRIMVELPGVKEPERVRKLLQGSASLEFWVAYNAQEVLPILAEADQLLKGTKSAEASEEPAQEGEQKAEGLAAEVNEAADAESEEVASRFSREENPLFALLDPSYSGGCIVGAATSADRAVINEYLARPEIQNLMPADLELKWGVKGEDYAGGRFLLYALRSIDGKPSMDGAAVSTAQENYSQNGSAAEVNLTMTSDGASAWAQLTGQNVGKPIAIVLDGYVYSAPNVQNKIEGGSSVITGNFTIQEAQDLANVLKSGKVPAPARIIQDTVVGPSLGQESINAGMLSFLLAFALVLFYMGLFYKTAGWLADLALILNIFLLMGVLVSFGAVLTLPGIAGIVLTMGMAVDANVIIYERVKEELRAGKGLSKAITDGYKNAYSAIVDGQITTLLTGIVLFAFGSGPVQGFATTLIIGIITSVLTSIFITRIIFDDRVSKGKNVTFDNKLTRNFLQNTNVDFIGKKKIAYIVSGALIVISLVSIFTKGFTYGVDFTGGRTYVVRFDQQVNAEDVRAAAIAEFDGAVEVKQFGGESQMKITTQYLVENESTEADAEVESKLYNALKGFFATELTFAEFTSTLDNPNGIISSDKVGPTIANDITRSAIIAVIIALFVIFGYIAVRFNGWTWGLGGVTGLAHTALIVIGFFSLFSGILPFSLDIDQTFIAAILTIIGYAINDTVVIFDRIREYKELHPKADFKQNVNAALNSTLSRTMNTSLTTLITMLAIAIFGGEVIRGLAVALILGIVIGTYASIFIATPIMYDVTRKAEAKKEQK